MVWSKRGQSQSRKQGQLPLGLILVLILIVVGVLIYRWLQGQESDSTNETTQQQTTQVTEDVDEQEAEPAFDAAALATTLETWQTTHDGTASVVIADSEGNILAASNPDEVYFAASIYKLYVAYEGYLQVDRGEVDASEIYINGNTRGECLDLMIRDSDSPCAEKLWNELGKAKLTNQLKTYGINNTSMEGITTTASDAATMLGRIVRGDELSLESQAMYLSSMKVQDALYRRGLPSGFTELTVYNKVGWNELKEWHDTAIVELPDGRKLIVSVLSENVGMANVRNFGIEIEKLLLQ